jgi:hypothetical protein
MPVGLNISPLGVLSGVPTTWGAFSLLIEAVDADQNIIQQRYTLNVAPPGTLLPALVSAPAAISLTYVIGGPSPAPVPVHVTSTSTSVPFTAHTSGGTWLAVAPINTTSPAFLNVSFNPAGLPPGQYNGALTLTAASAVNSPLSVPVTLNVVALALCGYGVDSTASSIAASGGTASFGVIVGSSACAWAASTSESWIAIQSPGSGAGSGKVNFSIQPNPGVNTRVGTISVQGFTHTVTQFGSACAFTLSPPSLNTTAAGGITPVTVTASAAGCAWNTNPGSPWIRVTSVDHGIGSGSVDIQVDSNSSSASRSGSITIAGNAFNVSQVGAGCSYSLSSVGGSVPYTGTSAPLAVSMTAPAGCAWTTDPGPGWVTVSGGSGSGSGIVQFSVAANSSTLPRSAVASVGGQPYQVTQTGVPCSFSLGIEDSLLPSSGGTGKVTITADPSCGWIGESNAPWLTLSSSVGNGGDTTTFTASVNSNPTARAATLTIAGQNVTINQNGANCSYALRSSSASIPPGGGSSAVGVIAAVGCPWTATSQASFVQITGGAASTGTGNVFFSVQTNATGALRTGFISVAGQSFAVTQFPSTCAIALNSSSFGAGEFTGSGGFSYTTSESACPHTVQSYAGWIKVTSATYDQTNGAVQFDVAANGLSSSRSGAIKVGDEVFTITQAASTCTYTLTKYSQTFDRLGGTGEVPIEFAPAGCGAPVIDVRAPAGMITLNGPPVSSPGLYTEPFTVNIYQALINYIRQAQLLIGGQIFTIKQTSW